VVRKLVAPEDLVGPQPELTVDDRHGHRAVRLGGQLVLEDLLDEAVARREEDAVAVRGIVAAWLDGGGRSKELRALVDDGEADVHVVEVHVRRRVVADVLDLVMDAEE